MAVIEVNHQALRNMADAIEDYCESFYNEMRRADTGVQNMMAGGWVGDDAEAFKAAWENVYGKDTLPRKFCKSLENYGKALSAGAEAYKTVQENLYNMATLLPRY